MHITITNNRKEWIYSAILICCSLIAIFFAFPHIPAHLAFDEVEFARIALKLRTIPYTPYITDATGHSTLYFYILSLSLTLFGPTTFALRLPAAVFGVLSVFLMFRYLRITIHSVHIAFLGALIFLTAHWYLNFARFAFEATFLIFLELAALTALFWWLKNKKMRWLILTTFATSLAFHSYYPGKIFFILPLWFILRNGNKKQILIALVIFLTFIAPLASHMFFTPDVRISQISFLSDNAIPQTERLFGFLQNIIKTIGMPFIAGDMNGRHNYPGKAALNPILGIIMIIGLIARNRKEAKEARLSAWLLIILSIVPTLLTSPNDNPNMLRTVSALIPITFFVSSGLHSILLTSARYTTKKRMLILISFIVFFSMAYELRTYFTFQQRVFLNAFEITCPLDQVIAQNPIIPRCRVQHDLF